MQGKSDNTQHAMGHSGAAYIVVLRDNRNHHVRVLNCASSLGGDDLGLERARPEVLISVAATRGDA